MDEIRFDMGQEVRLIRNVRNDGSFRDLEKGEVLISEGEIGEIRTYGYFLQTQIIYQVYFPTLNKVVGIRDAELISAECEWIPCEYYANDLAKLTIALAVHGERIANCGDVVEVHRSTRDLTTGELVYTVNIPPHQISLHARYLEKRQGNDRFSKAG